jgi:hypothetical protein
MNMRNIFLLVIQLFLLLLTSVCVILCEESNKKYEYCKKSDLAAMTIRCYTSPEISKALLLAYQDKNNDQHDTLPVFLKNGVVFFRDIRKGYLGEKDLGKDGNVMCSYLLDQLSLNNVILCQDGIRITIPVDEEHVVVLARLPLLIVGTSDPNSVAQVLNYLYENITVTEEHINLPDVDMNKADVFTQK